MGADIEREKLLAAEAATSLVEDRMSVGLGTGSSADYFVRALAARGLELRCIATSAAIERLAASVGLRVEPFDGPNAPPRLDIAVDGADQVASDGWIVKGKGGAHTREKVVAAAAERFVVIVSSDKIVDRVAPPVPLELLPFGLVATLARLEHVRLREAPATPEGGVLADYVGPVHDPAATSADLSSIPGVVDHGLFAPGLVSEVLVGRGDAVERIPGGRS